MAYRKQMNVSIYAIRYTRSQLRKCRHNQIDKADGRDSSLLESIGIIFRRSSKRWPFFCSIRFGYNIFWLCRKWWTPFNHLKKQKESSRIRKKKSSDPEVSNSKLSPVPITSFKHKTFHIMQTTMEQKKNKNRLLPLEESKQRKTRPLLYHILHSGKLQVLHIDLFIVLY